LSPTPLLFYPFSPLPYLFHPSYPPSVFIQYCSTSMPHVLDCLCFLVAHSAPSLLSFRAIPVFSLLVPTSKSHHHFSISLALSLLRYSGISSVSILHSSLPSILSSNFATLFPAFTLSLFLLHSSLNM
jgi:hypothetical protein